MFHWYTTGKTPRARTDESSLSRPDGAEREKCMPKVTYIEFNGDEHVLNIDPGLSVMEGAVNNNVG